MTRKVALVTGGSKGIGLALVHRWVQAGHQVITCARDAAYWQTVVDRYPHLSTVDFKAVNLAQPDQTQAMFEAIRADYGRLDIAVNNASPKLQSGGTFAQVAPDDLFQTLIDDLWAPARCLQHELNLMSSGGAIVNVSSINGLRPTPSAAMYSAAKHGLEGLTHSVALEAIQSGIRINSVAPGVTWTPRWEQKQHDTPTIREDVEKLVPAGRFAEPDEIAETIEWLCSDRSRYIVGHTLVIDGGLSLK
ncbi:SDR family NAD(P)-dependent oxidoreductase [Photobacterium sp. TY1-4]|uniref:SDR family NAD(P)-dependent oxidoreductase n=1 Tax=Photobacterium sp. TY1-4 TaxID=2899122 RepID=UPI0021BE5B96|nr:SDR family oxidoreductase [Photobacterium sp. TY1-4]UXI04159.1 SDR family oxidoreductase [Photobacterium sp. TY1-4]